VFESFINFVNFLTKLVVFSPCINEGTFSFIQGKKYDWTAYIMPRALSTGVQTILALSLFYYEQKSFDYVLGSNST
jgi:hypothetical protein